LCHFASLRHAAFVADDTLLFTVDEEGAAWLWDLAKDNRPIHDLKLLSQLLSGWPAPQHDSDIDSAPASSGELRTIWLHLRSAYADDFHVLREELLAWHQWQAARCEEIQNWLGAVFHYDALLGLQPEDRNLANRRAQAQQELLNERANNNGLRE
jgi:hypothetical protein